MAENIIHIGEWQLQRKHAHRAPTQGDCDHKHIELDPRGDVVRCVKCNIQLSAFWALEMLADEYNRALIKLQHEREALTKAKAESLHLLAARKVEHAWRSRSMVPDCPHCGRGIFPGDGFGNSHINREIELRRRAVAEKQDQ